MTTCRTWQRPVETRGNNVVYSLARGRGPSETSEWDPVVDGELRSAAMAVGLRDDFFTGGGEGCKNCFPVVLQAVEEGLEGLVAGVFDPVRIFDVGKTAGSNPRLQ